jgi:Flp pilus assembly protein TadD
MAERYEELLRAGVEMAKEQRLDEAEDLLERALEQKPGDVQAMNMLGWVFWSRGDPAEAERYYRAALDVRPRDPYAHKGLGLCLVDRGLVDDGIASIKRAIDIRRNWGEPYFDLGVILAREKRWEESWRLLDAAGKLDESLRGRAADLLAQAKTNANAAKSR